VVSLRPAGGHDTLRRAAAGEGARLIALSPWRIAQREDAATLAALKAALTAPRVVFTSPNAVKAARALMPPPVAAGQRWFGVGTGTVRALRAAGASAESAPARMDSDGLLELEALRRVAGSDVGLVTAPGGRGLIAAELQARGAHVLRADVYERVPVALSSASIARLVAASGALWLALSSGEALHRIQSAMPAPAWQRLLRARVAAASERLAAQARGCGFAGIVIATGPGPGALVEAMARAHADPPQAR
jgi:uroporphyrinogen-III synthase